MTWPCDICENYPEEIVCARCVWGNPCLGCEDYDFEENTCRSRGGCAEEVTNYGN